MECLYSVVGQNLNAKREPGNRICGSMVIDICSKIKSFASALQVQHMYTLRGGD